MKITSQESNDVGWDSDVVEVYPSADEVQNAQRISLITWHRFLREPQNRVEVSIIKSIIDKINDTFPVGGVMENPITHKKGAIEDAD